MTSSTGLLQSPLYPLSECTVTFDIEVRLDGYTAILWQPSTFNYMRFKWQDPAGDPHKTSWLFTPTEYFQFQAPAWTSLFTLEVTALSPRPDAPTEWQNLNLMPLSSTPKNLAARSSAAAPDKYQTPSSVPLKAPISFKETLASVAYPNQNGVYFSEGEGYITPAGDRISYTELAQLNAGSMFRKSEIDFSSEPEPVSSLLPTAQNMSFWCAFRDIEFIS